MTDNIRINTRVLSGALTGVQRYVYELSSRIGNELEPVSPNNGLNGLLGHAWEQLVLPMHLRGKLLWSPSNTGPVLVEKQVLTLHDVNPLDNPQWVSKNFARLYRLLLPVLLGRVRKIITVSEFTKSRILYHFPNLETRIDVTPLAADQRFIAVNPSLVSAVKSKLNLPSGRYFLALGSLEPRKNLHRLLLAWERLLPHLPDDIWLVCVGGKGSERVFGDFVLQNIPRKVFFAGHVDDVYLPSIYSGAIASIYLSLYEGFGLPPLEAMSCGSPVIASNLASIPEVVGGAGLLVDPYNIDEIIEAILKISRDESLRSNLRQNGLERSQHFSWDKTALQTINILNSCI